VRILFVTPEVYPLAKVGGLGDVACALPKALRKLGEDVRIALPKYEWIRGKEKVADIGFDFNGYKKISVELTSVDGVPVYLLGNDEFFGGKVVYQGGKEETIKFAFFSKAVAELVRRLDFRPEVVHCNDWHNALVQLHLRLLQDKTPTVFTIHNLKYQGARRGLTLSDVGVPKTASDVSEKGSVNPMKAGILYSDIVSTVSKMYAKEITTKTYGEGLHKYLGKREIHGIVNGVDYDVWDPEKDQHIYRKYGLDEPDGKAENKSRLLEEIGLPQDQETPLLGMVSRVDPHKGLNLIAEAVPRILSRTEACFVMLGGPGSQNTRELWRRCLGKATRSKLF